MERRPPQLPPRSAIAPALPIRSPMLDWHAMSNDILTAARLLAAFLFCTGAALAQAPARPADAGGGELEVVWYTAMNTPDAAPLRKRFREKYPELNLTILRQPGEKIRTRILTEMRAGKFFWDVVSFNHLDMDALAQEGLLAAYASPEARSGFPAGAVDPEGRWAAIYVANTSSATTPARCRVRRPRRAGRICSRRSGRKSSPWTKATSNGTPPCSTISEAKRALPSCVRSRGRIHSSAAATACSPSSWSREISPWRWCTPRKWTRRGGPGRPATGGGPSTRSSPPLAR